MYTYDAWGNHIIEQDAQRLGDQNPFRYRGYYYDRETGLYWVQSRYYDPEVGRWINADDITYLDPERINGLNLYAYCLNNPIMMTDSTGCAPWRDTWWGKALGWVAVVAVAAVGIGLIVATGGLAAAGLIAANGLVASIMVGAELEY